MKKLLFLLSVSFICLGCEHLQSEYSQLIGKEINLDVVNANTHSKFTILFFSGIDDCVSCELQPEKWRLFVSELKSLDVSVVLLLHPSDEVYKNLSSFYSDLPIIYDFNDDFFNNNEIHKDRRFHCFLLDEDNKVILIGNPIHNPKIKELYIHTICERLGIVYYSTQINDDTHEANLGIFTKLETKAVTFSILNSESSNIVIDTLYSSCECTKVEIDRMTISPSETAKLTVTYTPDGVGDFYREVYVKLKNEEKLLVYKIRGKVE